MIIQKILFPTEDKLEEELFLRRTNGVVLKADQEIIILNKNSSITADTYFNSFSVAKWKKYTKIDNLELHLKLRGNAVVTVFGSRICNGELQTEQICRLHTKTEQENRPCVIDIDLAIDVVNVYFEICALDETVLFHGGEFVTHTMPDRNIRLAIDICTFHRYEYLRKNINVLKNAIIENPSSILYNNIDVFIVDNANDPQTKRLEDTRIQVFLQDQKGSTGGFTRGMLEIAKKQEFTHCILMDDDVYLYAPVLERLYSFLQFMREEYEGALLGGALLRMDKPCIQHESGALWNEGSVMSCKHNYDLQQFEYVVKNEIEEQTEYMGWWFCCVPMRAVEKNGYPIPVYFHREDIEYGLRNPKQITLNGICTWHEPFEFKTSAVNSYYDVRNAGVLMALYRTRCYKYCYYIVKNIMVNLFLFKYNVADLMLQGVEDFLRGADWIIENDSGTYYNGLKQRDFEERDASELAEVKFDKDYRQYKPKVKRYHKWLKYLLLNGNWMKSKNVVLIPVDDFDPSFLWNARCVYYYNVHTEKFFCCKKNRYLFWTTIMRMVHDTVRVWFGYRKQMDAWIEKSISCTRESFWRNLVLYDGDQRKNRGET